MHHHQLHCHWEWSWGTVACNGCHLGNATIGAAEIGFGEELEWLLGIACEIGRRAPKCPWRSWSCDNPGQHRTYHKARWDKANLNRDWDQTERGCYHLGHYFKGKGTLQTSCSRRINALFPNHRPLCYIPHVPVLTRVLPELLLQSNGGNACSRR